MAYNLAKLKTEIIRIKALSPLLDARRDPYNIIADTDEFDLLVADSRAAKDNEAMSAIDVDLLVARVNQRPGDWIRYECDAGGAGDFEVSQVFDAATGGGCTDGI
jgi:hypothetical protein